MRLFYYALGVVCAAYVATALTLFFTQDRLLLPATPAAPDLRTVPHPGESIDEWQVGGQYAGYVVTPLNTTPRGTVIVFHGNEESAENKLPLADTFTHTGYRVVIVEYPGHGRRTGARKMQAALATSREALTDTLARWPGPVYLVGESLGAGMAAQVVRGHEAAISGVLLLTPWDRLVDVAEEHYPLFPARWILRAPYDSVAAVAHYTGPLVIVGAQQDEMIPVGHARLFAREHPSASLVILPGANHDNWFDVMTQQQWQRVRDLLFQPSSRVQ
ncbi:alpha/beta fold hydrolase [Robbsia sp. KACC 23696]|uniref:alpha/beta hydrolase n=1 Tax=Robbsia sp. KACC 23696 TaxID=3149231 RepID=UPI00325B6C17